MTVRHLEPEQQLATGFHGLEIMGERKDPHGCLEEFWGLYYPSS